MKISVYAAEEGGIVVTAYLSKMDMMAQDRADKLLNYILLEMGDALVKEYVAQNKDRILGMISDEVIINALIQKIKESISLVGNQKST